MNILQETEKQITIGQTVANNFRTAEVFRKYGIDFCCKGGRLLNDVCNERNLDAEAIENELTEKIAISVAISENEYKSMPTEALADHLLKVHHTYVRESIPPMLAFLHKINKVHGERHPELNEIYDLFEGCAHELTHHMIKEESILFPAIKKLAAADKLNEGELQPFFFGQLENPISMMQDEHTAEGERFVRIAELTNNFTAPEDGCTTYRVAFHKLEEFQNDLFMHIHLENNILFPKGLALENKLMAV
jgi:regulator of cell morphogenesis and NO signaling